MHHLAKMEEDEDEDEEEAHRGYLKSSFRGLK
jgi:hypothetical protein